MAAALTAPSPASAQFFFNDGAYKPKPSKSAAELKRKRQKPAQISRSTNGESVSGSSTAAKSGDKSAAVEKKPEGPLVITVSLRRQRVAVYDQNGLLTEAPVSSGKFSTPTPTGIYAVLEKNRIHFSNLYDSAPMPNMQRITWSGVALHAGQLPGYAASHGCIRLPHGFSQKLFGLTTLGTRVIVTHEPVTPVSFASDRLFASYPDETSALHALLPASGTKVADASDSRTGPPREVGSVIGVSTALAAGAPSPLDEITAMRDARRQDLDRLATAVTDAAAAKTAAVEKAKEAVKASDAAKLALRNARVESERQASALRKAAQARDASEKKLENFERSLARKSNFTPEDTAKAASDEDKLETEAMDFSDKADAAKKDAETAAAAVKVADEAAAAADKARVAAIAAVHDADAVLVAAREADAAAKRREAKRNSPVHVFISRKTGKLYVRQGYEPILEANVAIADRDTPMGTHVFTALAVDPAKAGSHESVRWSVASVPTYIGAKQVNARDRAAREAAAAEAAQRASDARKQQTAEAALARISIPADIRLKIEDVMKPGSSLIVSDNGIGNETGKFTDFIVPVR